MEYMNKSSVSEVKVVSITGAAGRISYALIPLILSGQIFGPNVKIVLKLFDIPLMEDKLQGISMEIEDSNFPNLASVMATVDSTLAFVDADVIILLGGSPRGPGMERAEMIGINATGIAQQARDLEQYAKPTVKVICVANPANTNCLVAIASAPKLSPKNFSCLTRLDQERLRGMVASQYGGGVRDVVIWGNHSTTQVPYLHAATALVDGTPQRLMDMVGIELFMDEVTPRVQRRGAAIIKAQGASSAMSAAAAISAHLADWCAMGPSNEMFSMGILSNGNPYGIPPGIVYSFPCMRDANGDIEIVPGLELSPDVTQMLTLSVDELLAEKAEAEAIVGKINIPDSRL